MMSVFRVPLMAFLVLALSVGALAAQPARVSDPEKLEAFLEVTGFDVALESIRLSADSAPAMLGIQADAFGSEWSRLVTEVFDTDFMHNLAIEILSTTLDQEMLTHATDFYATDLGQRLVRAENESHLAEDDGLKSEQGNSILNALARIDSPRVQILQDLNAASDVADSAIRSIQEVQVRFLMAAAGAGVIDMQLDEPDLRAALRSQESDMRTAIKANALSNSAYTYQAFSDDEVETYAAALAAPEMQKVYALMNAVQYEIMANRFEEVADRLSRMQPSQDL